MCREPTWEIALPIVLLTLALVVMPCLMCFQLASQANQGLEDMQAKHQAYVTEHSQETQASTGTDAGSSLVYAVAD